MRTHIAALLIALSAIAASAQNPAASQDCQNPSESDRHARPDYARPDEAVLLEGPDCAGEM